MESITDQIPYIPFQIDQEHLVATMYNLEKARTGVVKAKDDID